MKYIPAAPIIVHVTGGGTSWATVVLAALGIIGTVVGTIFGVRFTQHGEDRRWNASQRALHNQAQAERLRMVYSRMVAATLAVEQVISERNTKFPNETIEQRDARHSEQIQQAVKHVGEVAGQILIEVSAKDVADLYAEMVKSVGWYVRIDGHPIGTKRTDALQQREAEIRETSEKIRATAKEHIATLDQPPEL